MLRQAREARGWSQAEVARRLNLRLAVIESIDDDHYKAGVALTFLRGYVKAYAKVVGVNEQQALAAFDGMSGIEQVRSAAATSMQSFSRKTRQQANDKWLKRISWLVLLGLVGSLVFWWWQDSGASYVERTLEPVISQQDAVPTPPAEVQAETAPAPLMVPSEPVEMPAEPLSQASAEPGVTATPVADEQPEAVSAAEPVSEVDAEPAKAVVDADSAAASPVPAADPRRLVLSFSADCWIQITDAEGRVLSEGVKTSRDNLVLEGEPPFRLVLGAPRAASVEYLGQPVDLSSFSAGRVARLTVPQS